MQLVLVAHGGRTTFEIAHISIIIGNDQRALKLSCITSVNTEITAQFHGTAYTLGDVDKRAIGEDSRVQRCKEIVLIGHHRSQIFAHQVRMLLDGITYRTKDDTFFAKFLLEGGLHADRVHDGIDSGIA